MIIVDKFVRPPITMAEFAKRLGIKTEACARMLNYARKCTEHEAIAKLANVVLTISDAMESWGSEIFEEKVKAAIEELQTVLENY
jgi:hypothetical protein